MAASGFYWFVTPGRIAQKMSVAVEKELMPALEIEMRELGIEAANIMRQRITTGGLGGKVARIETAAMLESVDSKTFINGRDRIQNEFGYIDNAPEYTKYQEYGTATTGWGKGIEALDAMNMGLTYYEQRVDDIVPKAAENMWEGIWS